MPKFRVIAQETLTYEVEVKAKDRQSAWDFANDIIQEYGGHEFVEKDSSPMEVVEVIEVFS